MDYLDASSRRCLPRCRDVRRVSRDSRTTWPPCRRFPPRPRRLPPRARLDRRPAEERRADLRMLPLAAALRIQEQVQWAPGSRVVVVGARKNPMSPKCWASYSPETDAVFPDNPVMEIT